MWLLAYQFEDAGTAERAYKRVRDFIFGREIDASVYRVQLKGVSHVIGLGESTLTEDARQHFEKSCHQGLAVEIPDDIANTLIERRKAGRFPGFWEANHRPGQVVDTQRRRRRAS